MFGEPVGFSVVGDFDGDLSSRLTFANVVASGVVAAASVVASAASVVVAAGSVAAVTVVTTSVATVVVGSGALQST